MKLVAVVLVLFLLAFAGMAIGLIVRRRGLRSGCGHAPADKIDCRCETELDSSLRGQTAVRCKNAEKTDCIS